VINASFNTNEKDDISLLNKIHSLDLSKLNLDDLLILLYRLQQKTAKNSVTSSSSTISCSSNSSSTGFIYLNQIIFY
jgi:thiazolylpeptide-type bacteriocin precursor